MCRCQPSNPQTFGIWRENLWCYGYVAFVRHVYNTMGRRDMSFGDFSKCVTHALMDFAFARGGDRRSLDG
jgi:hypothetical protein